MARNKITDLNDHLFAQLERLDDDKMDKEQMEIETKRAKAITGLATQIVNSHRVTLEAMKLVSNGTLRDSAFPDSFGVKKLSQ